MFRHFQYLILVMVSSASGLQSQYYFYDDRYYNSLVVVEAGLSIGGMNCLTDLGGKKGNGKPFLKDINWQNTAVAGGIYVSMLYDQSFGLRAEATFGNLSASDNVLKNDHSAARNRYNRNLHFKTTITEGCVVAEILPLSILNTEKYRLFSPYLLAGIGIFKFNPQALFSNQWVRLHPLRTEGQGFKEYPDRQPYKLAQLNFPVGLGTKYEISGLINIRLEVIYRFLPTDYLDDVSTSYIDPALFYSNLNADDAVIAELVADRGSELTPGHYSRPGEIRGNPKNKDGYFSFNLKIGLVLNRKHR